MRLAEQMEKKKRVFGMKVNCGDVYDSVCIYAMATMGTSCNSVIV